MRYTSGTLPTSYGYTGQRADAATGLDYYNARYYDHVAGQFTSADTTPAGGLNRYAYVDGNPETYIDPSGHALREGAGGEGGGLSGGDGTVGGGESSGDSWGGSGDPGGSVSGLPPSMTVGDELTYDAGSAGADSFHLDAAGNVDGVEGSDGQLLETNAQIEAQAQADAQDRLNQSEQPHGDGLNGGGGNGQGQANSPGNTTPDDLVQAADNLRQSTKSTGNRPPAATVVATVNGGSMQAVSGVRGTSAVGIGDGQTCAECAFARDLTTTFPQGLNGEQPLEGQTLDIGLSHVNGREPCLEVCQGMFGELSEYTGATFRVWWANRAVRNGPISGINGPFIVTP